MKWIMRWSTSLAFVNRLILMKSELWRLHSPQTNARMLSSVNGRLWRSNARTVLLRSSNHLPSLLHPKSMSLRQSRKRRIAVRSFNHSKATSTPKVLMQGTNLHRRRDCWQLRTNTSKLASLTLSSYLVSSAFQKMSGLCSRSPSSVHLCRLSPLPFKRKKC